MDNIKNYIEESENDKITSKMSKLESQVKKLNLENNNLKVKVNNLETILEKVCAQLKIKTNFNNNNTTHTNSSKNETDIEETWLYYVKKNKARTDIINQLNFTNNPVVIELKVDNWLNENKILIDLLNSFPKFKEFSEDWSSMTNKQLINFLQTILSSTLVYDTVIILRNLPSKSDKKYESAISNVATVADVMSATWEDLELSNEIMGKMALVLESEEELQILNVIKNDSRSILIVDSLF